MIGTSLGRYRILAEIGKGGMGTVYRGVDLLLERDIAVKVILRSLSSKQRFAKRFRKEAQASARLNHPNIVRTYDLMSASGLYFVVMEYVDGKTLKNMIQEEKVLPFEKVIDLTGKIASAVDYAHQNGIIHGDIKPGNVLISRKNHLKVSDFGVAVSLESLRNKTSSQIVGTPAYVSPEQALGKEMCFASDIYSLAVMTCEMLAGKHPFPSETPLGVVYKHAYEKSFLLKEFQRKVRSVFSKAMAKDPVSRHSSASAFVGELSVALRESPRFFH